MCLPAVTESDIASVEVTEGDTHLHTVVKDHDGKVLIEEKYTWTSEYDPEDDGKTIQVYRMFGAQGLKVFKMTIDYDRLSYFSAYPVTVSDIVGLTVTHMKAVVSKIMGYKYEASDVKKSKYGAVTEVLFEDKNNVDERTARHSKELEKVLPVPELEYVPL